MINSRECNSQPLLRERQGMAHAAIFLVVGFARGRTRKLRAEVIMRAPSESQAAELAADLARKTGAAIAFSQTHPASPAKAPTIKILANCGGVSEDPGLWGLEGVPSNDWKLSAHSTSGRIIGGTPTRWISSRIAFFGMRRGRRSPERARIFRLVPCISAAVVAAFAVSAVALRASAAQREARLVEMARPSCDHERVTNQELHRFVRYVTRTRATKQEALAVVLTLCQAKSDRASLRRGIKRTRA
jgi:hypothetical protein